MTPALEDTLLAVSTAQLAQRTNQPELLHESLRLYTQGISKLRRDILNPTTRQNDQNLAACLAALIYEAKASPGESNIGYKAHYHGTLELLRLRGPEAHGSGLVGFEELWSDSVNPRLMRARPTASFKPCVYRR
jgi:hypothetical protein